MEIISNRYQILEQIGHGGMADVYLAYDLILKREVAVKLLHSDQSSDPVGLERFRREAGASTSLSHPNIVDIYDVGEDAGRPYIVMEYVKSYTLKQLLAKRGPLPVNEAVWLMRQLASALLEAHKNGIIHRDVKSQNVLIKADGTVKLSDFGIALASGNMQLTSDDAVVGSVHYIAPECVKGQPATVQSDIYSLGIVFYETLIGEVPFKGERPIEVAMKQVREPLPSLRSKRNDIPQSVENIVIKACAKLPKNRYKNMLEMLSDLSICLKSEHSADPKLILENDSYEADKEAKKKAQVQEEIKQKRKSKAFYVILISLIVLVSSALLAMILFLSGVIKIGNKAVVVPDIVGLSVIEADDKLDELGLVLDYSNIEREMTDSIPAGLIISSLPQAGEEAEKGSKVKVLVSEGIYQTMDNLVGKNIEDVRNDLRNKNFRIEEKASQSDEIPGTIIAQSGILAGEKYNPNVQNFISLTYSEYPSILIPFGTVGRDVDEVFNELSEKGFSVEKEILNKDDLTEKEVAYGAYKVIRISPEEGNSYRQIGDAKIIIYYYEEN